MKYLYVLFALFCVLVMAFSIRGIQGNPTPQDLNRSVWKDDGPLELSPERGRYALLYALAETNTFYFSPELAKFAAPDVGYTDGKYVSLFAPTVSFIVVPGYLFGKFFNMAQVGSYAVIAIFALFNVALIRAIAIRLGIHPIAAIIGGLTFLFASPAFAYAVTLYQHHISTFIILSGVYLLIRYNTLWSLTAIWLLCALSISVDYPNFLMMLPIGILALGRTFIGEKKENKLSLSIPLLRVFAIFTMALPLAFFLWFNNASNGSPLRLSGMIERAIEVRANGTPLLEGEILEARRKALKQPPIVIEKSFVSAFQSRLLLNGFYTHFISPDRGMLMYTPVMLFGIAGLVLAIKRRMKYVGLLVAVIGFNVLLYSMWDDPYGGWAFGSRYLIPTYAILSLFVAYFLTRFSKYNMMLLLFFAVLSYSISVNTLGAITSNRNPPKIEAAALAEVSKREEPYTYMRNVNLLNNNISKSYIFETYAANNISAWHYYTYLTAFIIIVSACLLMLFKRVTKGVSHAV